MAMDPSFAWHHKSAPDTAHLSNGTVSASTIPRSNGLSASNISNKGNTNGDEWSEEFGFVNESSGVDHAMQQPGFYNAAWNPYDTFTDYNGSLASTPSINMNLNPAALLAQSAHGASNGGTPQENTETPATIDPTLMMTINPSSYSQYVSPTQTQYLPSGSYAPSSHGAAGAASYQPYMPHSAGGSSLTQVLDYTPELGDSSIPLPPPSPLPQSTEPLIDQVKKLLTAKQLDQVPQETAHKLIDLLLPGKSSSDNKSAPVPVAVDKDTRLEIFTRIRDNAPKQFFAVLANDLDALTLLREWGKNAAKKEEFEETLMGWLQIIERLPLSLVSLSQSGLGRIIKYVVDHPPTNAVKDMASKIESGWKKTIAAEQVDGKSEADPRGKKRKHESTPSITPKSTASSTPGSTVAPPPTKKAAVTNATGVKVAVRRDSTDSPTNGTAGKPSTNGPASASASSSTATKGAQSDSSFFSAKPKPKLPSFRKKLAPAATTTSTPPSASATSAAKPNEDTPMQAQNPDYNPFTDALKAVRKGSPAVPPGAPNAISMSNTVIGSTPGISAKTGKPKKNVRFAPDGELEKIKWITKAIYDDDGPSNSVHGQSYRDLDRAEGNLLKRHLIAQIEWYEPSAVTIPSDIVVTIRGEKSEQNKIQADRESSALAAVYQGAPPDTPIEPPHLAALPVPSDDATVRMLLGNELDGEIQGTQDSTMTPGHWLGQLAPEALPASYGAPPASVNPYGNTSQQPFKNEEIGELLQKILSSKAQDGSGQGLQQVGQQAPYNAGYGGAAPSGYPSEPVTNAAAIPNAAALLSALSALGVPQQNNANGNAYFNGGGVNGYGGGGSGYGGGDSYAASSMNDGVPGREDDEDRWRRSSRGDSGGPAKRGRGGGPGGDSGRRKDVPASQNTWRPLCTFFARGRCRFGENCDFSHDPSKLANTS